jgi:hypothetical protein
MPFVASRVLRPYGGVRSYCLLNNPDFCVSALKYSVMLDRATGLYEPKGTAIETDAVV